MEINKFAISVLKRTAALSTAVPFKKGVKNL